MLMLAQGMRGFANLHLWCHRVTATRLTETVYMWADSKQHATKGHSVESP